MDELERGDIQGLLRHGYPYFEAAAYCLFEIDDPAGTRAWLTRLLDPDERWIDNAYLEAPLLRDDGCGVAIAFTRPGLARLGLEAEDLETFVTEFQEGMARRHRSALLGDVGASAPQHWDWGRGSAIHGLLIVFAHENGLEAAVDEIRAIPGRPTFLRRINGFLRPEDPPLGVVHEPFGFADGISQPVIRGLTRKPAPPGVRMVSPGEFVLGYRNEIGRLPASPSVGRNSPVHPLPATAGGRADFGRNGSYLVMRQLEQDVDAFRRFVGADELRAARLVGRWRSGAPLLDYPAADHRGMTQRELEARNGFSYHRADRHGLRCPIGAHIRRANPRDALADGLGITPERALELVNQHRILRRGRIYEANGKKGLAFLCLNANIERQFEFVQGSWIMHPEFGGLAAETDPLLGNAGRPFTVQRTMVAERCDGLQQFVTVKGGAYFFLPGLRALRYLSRLDAIGNP
jgi:Dyp-type peroxidase family